MILIRPIVPTDFERIQKLGENFALSSYEVDSHFRTLTHVSIPIIIATQLSNPMVTTFVAEINSHIIGFISFIKENTFSQYLQKNMSHSPNCASILFVSVDKKFHNKKIGALLVQRCIEYCRMNQIDILRITTDYGNFPALALYQKCGFNVIHSWHIYRLYRENLSVPGNSQDLLYKSDKIWAEPYEQFIMRRSFSWLYETAIDQQITLNYLKNSIQEQINNETLIVVQKQMNQKSIGMTLKHDKNRQNYYQLPGSIWTICDLLENKRRGEFLPLFIRQQLYNLPNFLMAEIWINAHDYESQKIVMQAGMQFVYGGISLHLKL